MPPRLHYYCANRCYSHYVWYLGVHMSLDLTHVCVEIELMPSASSAQMLYVEQERMPSIVGRLQYDSSHGSMR